VLNLLSNAVKFTLTGGVTVQVELAEDVAMLRVRDTGIGIPADEVPRIFDRFHRVSGRLAHAREGAGIGLSLVADLVHAHGGTIEVDSALGTGSTFTVTIPVTDHQPALPHEAPNEVAQMYLADAAQWAPAPDPRPTPPELTRRGGHQGTVLVVEDNTDMRDYLTRLLSQDGWTVIPVGTVDAALEQKATPDLVLADVMLPVKDGLDLLRILRSTPDAHRVPVVLLTARAGPESIVEGLALGADDYLVKPFEPVELLARVRATVELQRRHESSLARAENRAANLEEALATNRRIGTAVGILMAARKIHSDRAFELLSTTSQALHRKLRDIADEVVSTGALPSR
jgi:DNA-binding response OmpR family regulator